MSLVNEATQLALRAFDRMKVEGEIISSDEVAAKLGGYMNEAPGLNHCSTPQRKLHVPIANIQQ